MKPRAQATGKTPRKFRGYEIRRLLRACQDGRVSQVRKLLAEGHDPNEYDDYLGDRPLHVAAREGHVAVARVLLSAGADIDARGGYGDPARPLDRAAEAGRGAMVRFLLSRGAKINVGGESRALFSAAWAGCPGIVALLIREGARLKKDTLYWGVRSGNMRVVRLLLRAGADVNGDGTANKPVCAAASLHKSAELLKVLAAHGADLRCTGQDDRATLLHIVANEDAALFLIGRDLDINAADRSGKTPLHHCAKKGFARACRRLLERGADLRAKTRRGYTPRQYASLYGRPEVFSLFTKALKHTRP